MLLLFCLGGGGVILVSHFTNYISMLCASMEIGKPAGCVPLFVAEVNWTIGLYGVCVVTEMPMDINTLDTWALWLLCSSPCFICIMQALGCEARG